MLTVSYVSMTSCLIGLNFVFESGNCWQSHNNESELLLLLLLLLVVPHFTKVVVAAMVSNMLRPSSPVAIAVSICGLTKPEMNTRH